MSCGGLQRRSSHGSSREDEEPWRLTRGPVAAGVAGVLLLAATAFWSTLVVPQLVRFPLSTDMTLHYSGQVVVFVDQRTGATLATPTRAPLTVERHIQALPGRSTSSVAVVDEHLTARFQSTSDTEHNRYAFDRRDMAEVESSEAFSFAPGNPGAAEGSYYITLPMGLTTARCATGGTTRATSAISTRRATCTSSTA